MNEELKMQNYELSLWEDYNKDSVNDTSFEERKIAVIGGSLVKSESAAYNINLKENVNGEKTLTFNIAREYYNDQNELVKNPFLSLLTPERTIKLRDGDAYDFNDITELQEEDNLHKWKDFIIKSVDEDKESNINTYICKETYINELGKNGWSVILDSELENNYGTLIELGERILEGSDWKIAKDSYQPTAKVNEQLFVTQIADEFLPLTATKIMTNEKVQIESGYIYFFYSEVEAKETNWITKDTTGNREGLQILWAKDKIFTTDDVDDNNVILDMDNNYNYELEPGVLKGIAVIPVGSFNDPTNSLKPLLGGKIVKSVSSHFEPVADKYVEDWKVIKQDTAPEGMSPTLTIGEKVYSYLETEYNVSDIVKNYLANSDNFVSPVGWYYRDAETINEDFIFHTMEIPDELPNNENIDQWFPTNYMVLPKFPHNSILQNEGPANEHLSIVQDNIYVVRWKARIIDKTQDKYTNASLPIDESYANKIEVSLVTGDSGGYLPCTNTKRLDNFIRYSGSITGETNKDKRGYPNPQAKLSDRTPYAITNTGIYTDEQGYAYVFLKGSRTTKTLGEDVFLQLSIAGDTKNTNYCWHIKDIQFFDYKEQIVEDKTVPIFPGDIPEATAYSTRYFYRIQSTATGKQVEMLPSSTEYYEPILRKEENYTAIRHLEVKESNYFNNINNLAELFEVWVSYRIKHDKTGRIIKENGSPVKEVVFSQYAPNDNINYAGFKYGVNLKNIKRTIDSNNITSKLIVKDNENEFADGGICSITQAQENPSGENIIYNFDYFINQGLIEQQQLIADLYGLLPTNLGYYSKMKNINNELMPLNQLLIKFTGQVQYAQDMIEYIKTSIDSTRQELLFQQEIYNSYIEANIGDDTIEIKKMNIAQLQAKIVTFQESLAIYEEQEKYYNIQIYGAPTEEDRMVKYVGIWKEDNDYYKDDIVSYEKNNELILYKNLIKENQNKPDSLEGWQILDNYDELSLLDKIDFLKDKKKLLNLKLFTKYHKFIQEGTWTDNQYIDNELYYFDALKVSSQNAYPKISYTISTVDLGEDSSELVYRFKIGERTYIEDPQFFGYENKKIVLDNGETEVIKTPFKKEVVVTERTRVLDDLTRSSITIQTYKNEFEELFSKIASTTTSLQYASGGYQRAANTITPNGEIKMESLEEAMSNNAWILANSKNQDVIWDSGLGIIVTDKGNSSTAVRITSNGIMMTTDGGKTWINGITGNGINTRYLIAGQIDASKINIVDETGYAFKWNKQGLSAFNKKNDETNEMQFVRYNRYGIFGTTQGSTLESELALTSSVDEAIKVIEKYSNFSLTWNGLSLRNNDGGIALQPLNGLEIFEPNLKFTQDFINANINAQNPDGETYSINDEIPLVSLGKFKSGSGINYETTYGLRIRNKKGNVVLEGNKDGLFLEDQLVLGNIKDENDFLLKIIGININNKPEDIELETWLKDQYVFQLTDTNKQYLFQLNGLGQLTTNEAILNKGFFLDRILIGQIDNPYAGLNKYYPQEIKEFTITNTIVGTTEQQYTLFDITSYILNLDAQALDKNMILWNNMPVTIIRGTGETEQQFSGLLIIKDKPTETLDPITLEKQIVLRTLEKQLLTNDIIQFIDNFTTVIWIGNESQPLFYVDSSGRLTATNAQLAGDITAYRGFFQNVDINSGYFSGYLSFGQNSQNYIGIKDDSEFLLNINDNFKVSNSGLIIGNELRLANSQDNPYVIIQAPKIGTNDVFTIQNYDESGNPEVIFSVDKNGTVKLAQTLYGDNVKLTGEIKVGDDNDQIVIDGNNGSIFANNNMWSIQKTGDAVFHNILARGKIETILFEQMKTSSVGGTLVISPSIYTEKDITKTLVNGENKYDLTSELISYVDNWGDFSNPKEVRIEIQNQNEIIGRVEKNGDKYYLSYIEGLETLPKGTLIICQDLNASFIELSAVTPGGGSAIIISNSKQGIQKRTVLGTLNVNTLPPNHSFPSDINDIGLYSDSAYLEGKVYLPNGGITDEGDLDSSIRFWAGTSAENRENAPFRVTQDGSLYASKGIFSGTIEAGEDSIFNGTIEVAGIIISDDPNKHNHFYIKKADLEEENKYVIDFNKYGANIWEGGLNIFSDYYLNKNNPYYKEGNGVYYYLNNQYPFPIFTILNDNIDMAPIISGINYHSWFIENGIASGIKITNNKISYSSLQINTETEYALIEKKLWDATSIWEISENNLKFNNNFNFYDTINKKNVMSITSENILFNTKINFNNIIAISTNEYGIYFDYIGG